MDSHKPLRSRRRAQLVNEIWRTGHHLFAQRGFDAVTMDELAAATGISKSTAFRYVSSKDALLLDPLLEGISSIVETFEARPATETAGVALTHAVADCVSQVDTDDLATWRAAIRTAPQLIARVTLVRPADRERLIELAAQRMDTAADPSVDSRPGLLVTVALAASEYIFQNWITDDSADQLPLHEQAARAIRTVLDPDPALR